MKKLLTLLILLCLEKALHAQYVYTIKADSVKITNTCDTAELIIENHTQTVPGFLFNKGRGRTEFRRAMTKLNDSIYVIGIDTLRLSVAWLQGGNKFGATGVFGTRDNNHIDFYTNNTKRGRWTNSGNFLINGDADYGYKMAVNGTTYSQFYTNSTTSLGNPGSGALRLRWGGGEGTYFDFYYQGRDTRRGIMGTASDSRPLYIYDSVGFSFLSTPFVAIGIESGASQNSRFTIASDRSTNWDAFTILGFDNVFNKDFTVRANGNTILGGGYGTDNGRRFQVYGTSWFRDEMNIGNDQYYIALKPAYGNGYGTGIDASMITFGNVLASIGVNKQTKGNMPANSLLMGGVSPDKLTAITDYYGNPTFITHGNGAVTIYGGYKGIINGVTGFDANSNAYAFNICGGLGTGSGSTGDINFSTANAQPSGTTLHSLSLRWTIKGGTGFLSNNPNPTSTLDINGNNGYSQLRLRSSYTPSSTSDTNGNVGDVSWDDNYFYIKTSTGWKRSALSTF